MKSKDLTKKTFSDFSSQDELSKGRALKSEKVKRSKKPSIYDEFDEELEDYYATSYKEDDLIDEYDDEDDRY